MLDKGDSGKEGATLSTTTIFPYPPPCPPPPYFWQGTLLPESPCSLAREDTAAAAPQHHLSPTSIGSREARGAAPSTPLPCFSHRRGCAMRRCYTLSSALLQPQVCLRQVALPQRHLPVGSAIPLDKEDRRQGRGRLPSLPFPTFLVPLFSAPAPDNRAIRALKWTRMCLTPVPLSCFPPPFLAHRSLARSHC